MKTIFHKADERGQGEYGWLTTRYSFSFADWVDPHRMGFGTLRVINDDIIAPQKGFGTHFHKDMEIITIVMKGTVTHKDSMGNVGTVPAGDVQVISAGTGIEHSEYNDSTTIPLELFQIWIEPELTGIEPRYEQRSFNFTENKDGITTLVGYGGVPINQNAKISYACLSKEKPIRYEIGEGNGLYVFVIGGNISINKQSLGMRDALAIKDTVHVDILVNSGQACTLLIEVPMKNL